MRKLIKIRVKRAWGKGRRETRDNVSRNMHW